MPKRQRSTKAKSSSAAAAPQARETLDERIAGHNTFFNGLLERIPREFVLPREEDPDAWQRTKGKYARNESSEQRRKNNHKSKKAKFDGAGASSINEAQRAAKEKDEEGAASRVEEDDTSSFLQSEGMSEEQVQGVATLQERLSAKIQKLREGRKFDPSVKKDREAVRLQKAEKKKLLQQRKKAGLVAKGSAVTAVPGMRRPRVGSGDSTNTNGSSSVNGEMSSPTTTEEDIQFGSMIVPVKAKTRATAFEPKRSSKINRLRQQLAKAEEKDRRMAAMERTEEGAVAAEHIKWKDAIANASGEKTRDSAALIKKALKRRDKKKEKSRREWGKRLKAQNGSIAERQQQRNANLLKRKNRGAAAGDDDTPKRSRLGAGFDGRRGRGEFLNKEVVREKKGGGGGAQAK